MNQSMRLYQRADRGGEWYVAITRTKRISLKTKDKRVAQELFRQLQKDYLSANLAVLAGRPRSRPLGEFVVEYLTHRETTASRATYRADALALGKLAAHLGDKTALDRIDRRAVDRFLADLGRTGAAITSIAIWFRHCRAAFGLAVKWGYLKSNPWSGGEPRPQKTPPRFLSPEEIKALLAAETAPAFRRLWEFYLFTGVRRREAMALTWRDVDQSARLITIPATKNRRARSVRITDEVARILASLPHRVGRLFPWTPDGVSHHFARTATRAGVKARLHDLRHTFASYVLMRGGDMAAVKALLGHEDIKATLIYAHLDRGHLDRVLDKLSYEGEAD